MGWLLAHPPSRQDVPTLFKRPLVGSTLACLLRSPTPIPHSPLPTGLCGLVYFVAFVLFCVCVFAMLEMNAEPYTGCGPATEPHFLPSFTF